jgi:O-6-methylguanine DNA methyltransferase
MIPAPDRTDARLRAVLAPPAPPAGLAARVLRAVDATATVAPPKLDVTASTDGVVRVMPGTGRIEAAGARARDWAARAADELAEYFAGERTYFSVPTDIAALAPFHRRVLEAARTIPFGETRPYAWIAARIGTPAAVRAVGTALGRNPIPFVIPCHRVLRTDGTLGGYGLGLPLKQRLLRLEHDVPALVGCTTTKILCRPGCPALARAHEANRVVFASTRDARSVGYRACRICRPGTPTG